MLFYDTVLASATSTRISHRYATPPLFLNSPPSHTPSYPSRLSQNPGLSSLFYTANSHWLSILHVVVHVSMLFSPVHPTLSLSSVFLKIQNTVLLMILAGPLQDSGSKEERRQHPLQDWIGVRCRKGTQPKLYILKIAKISGELLKNL